MKNINVTESNSDKVATYFVDCKGIESLPQDLIF